MDNRPWEAEHIGHTIDYVKGKDGAGTCIWFVGAGGGRCGAYRGRYGDCRGRAGTGCRGGGGDVRLVEAGTGIVGTGTGLRGQVWGLYEQEGAGTGIVHGSLLGMVRCLFCQPA